MKGLLNLLNLNFLPKSPDFALLILRAALGAGMLRHGWDKFGKWDQFKATFYDPFRIGSQWTLGFTVFAEVICSGLLIIGFCTRFAALILAFTFGITFFMALKGDFTHTKGELTALYFACYMAILFAGPGKYAFDGSGGGGGPPGH